jgi:glutathionylspermidine synthase
MLLSNKGILPILWELYPGHENLLEAHFDSPAAIQSYVRKPLLSREGANITLVRPDTQAIETDGPYTGRRAVCQTLTPDAIFDDRYPILGLWMVDQECCGLGIRESAGPITDNYSSFVPHFFV